MKVVITEEQYKQILNEDLGVSRATIPFINIVLNEVMPIVEDMTFNKKNDSETINLDYNTMKQVVKSDPDSFIEFPVEGLDIEIKFGYVKKPTGNAKFRQVVQCIKLKKNHRVNLI
jgi:hypothetical protein